MIKELKSMFEKQLGVERFDLNLNFPMLEKQEDGFNPVVHSYTDDRIVRPTGMSWFYATLGSYSSEIPIEVEGFEPSQEEVSDSGSLGPKRKHSYKAGDVSLNLICGRCMKAEISIKVDNMLLSMDYEIWQMDVKNGLLNSYLDDEGHLYGVQLEGFVVPNHPKEMYEA
ncbi:hypothetical protein Tco_0564939 [Tanacetum coccineum]